MIQSYTNKPNLFIVGNPKSGTTALHDFLKQHPEIFMSEPKEPHYFASDIIKESDDFHGKNNIHFKIRTLDDYMALFKGAREKIRGEASTRYLMSKDAPSAIYEFNPETKIIIMLRNPVEFAYSWYKQSFFTCGEYIKPFRKAVLAESDRRKGKKLSPRIRFPSAFYYSEFVRYKEQVQKYIDLFGKKKVKVIIFEDFKADNYKIYQEVLSFLEVDEKFRPKFNEINKSREIKYNLLYYISTNPQFIIFFRYIFPDSIRKFIKSQILKIVAKEEKRKPIDKDLECHLRAMYYDEVVKISHYLNRDLVSFWGFEHNQKPIL